MRYLPRSDDGTIRKMKDYRVTACFERYLYHADKGRGIQKKQIFEIQRDKWGKFSVVVDGRKTQSNLAAEAIVRYMANMLHGGK